MIVRQGIHACDARARPATPTQLRASRLPTSSRAHPRSDPRARAGARRGGSPGGPPPRALTAARRVMLPDGDETVPIDAPSSPRGVRGTDPARRQASSRAGFLGRWFPAHIEGSKRRGRGLPARGEGAQLAQQRFPRAGPRHDITVRSRGRHQRRSGESAPAAPSTRSPRLPLVRRARIQTSASVRGRWGSSGAERRMQRAAGGASGEGAARASHGKGGSPPSSPHPCKEEFDARRGQSRSYAPWTFPFCPWRRLHIRDSTVRRSFGGPRRPCRGRGCE